MLESPSRQSLSAMWQSPGRPPARIRVYNEEALTQLLMPSDGSTAGRGLGRTQSLRQAKLKQKKAERRRAAQEEEDQRMRRYERHRAEADKRQAASIWFLGGLSSARVEGAAEF